MNRLQTAALWIAAVALAVIAVFTTVDSFDEPEATPPSVWEADHWTAIEGWACVNAYIEVVAVERWDFFSASNPDPQVLDLLDQLLGDCVDRFGTGLGSIVGS